MQASCCLLRRLCAGGPAKPCQLPRIDIPKRFLPAKTPSRTTQQVCNANFASTACCGLHRCQITV